MPSIVTLASATFVATITLRVPRGAGKKTAPCSLGARPAYNGRGSIGSEPGGSAVYLSWSACSAVWISSRPVRKTRISPIGCVI